MGPVTRNPFKIQAVTEQKSQGVRVPLKALYIQYLGLLVNIRSSRAHRMLQQKLSQSQHLSHYTKRSEAFEKVSTVV
jgi:hypothetical protein